EVREDGDPAAAPAGDGRSRRGEKTVSAGRTPRLIRALAAAVFVACAVGGAVAAQAQAPGTVLTPRQRERERTAMSAYVAGRYQEALEMYADLYADFHDPVYLRNIGRCHQKLKHPDEAISSFEEYLARYKRLSATEIEQVQG